MDPVTFFKDNSKNKSTTKATGQWTRIYQRWAATNNQPMDITNLEKNVLNNILEIYFAQALRLDGKNYEPSSLTNMQAGIDRYLKENGCTFSIIKDWEFLGSRNVLEGLAKHLRDELGMGQTLSPQRRKRCYGRLVCWAPKMPRHS